MLLFYNISISLYYLAIRLAAVFNPKAKLWVKGREGLLDRIEKECTGFKGKTVCVHCASLGEFEMARPIMEGIKSSSPDTRLILTFFSPSGYEVRNDYDLADHVYYLPIDTSNNANRFVLAINPSRVVFVKYDLWYHYLNESKNIGAQLILISAQFRPNQFFFKLYGSIGRRTLHLLDQIFCVDKPSKDLL